MTLSRQIPIWNMPSELEIRNPLSVLLYSDHQALWDFSFFWVQDVGKTKGIPLYDQGTSPCSLTHSLATHRSRVLWWWDIYWRWQFSPSDWISGDRVRTEERFVKAPRTFLSSLPPFVLSFPDQRSSNQSRFSNWTNSGAALFSIVGLWQGLLSLEPRSEKNCCIVSKHNMWVRLFSAVYEMQFIFERWRTKPKRGPVFGGQKSSWDVFGPRGDIDNVHGCQKPNQFQVGQLLKGETTTATICFVADTKRYQNLCFVTDAERYQRLDACF